jgi:hypothetical protein
MNGNNTEDNKRNFFKQQFEGMMVDYINERFDFYKKMEANPEMKNHIFRLMYSNYNDQRPST